LLRREIPFCGGCSRLFFVWGDGGTALLRPNGLFVEEGVLLYYLLSPCAHYSIDSGVKSRK